MAVFSAVQSLPLKFSLPLINVVMVIFISAILYSGYGAVYRLYFHPLAKFPGPFFARISPVPAAWAVLVGRIPFFTKACHDKYGPVVRIAPNELSFDDETSWKDIYGSRSGHKNFHKDPIHVGSVESIPGVTTITMADDENHARQRRALSHAFSTKALMEQEYIVRNYVDMFSDKMKEFSTQGKPVDIVDWFAYTTFDIIGDMALGEPFGCLTNDDFHFWVPLISETIKAGAIEQVTRRLAPLGSKFQKILFWFIPTSIRGTRKNHLAYSKAKVLKRMAQTDNEHKDFLYYLIKQRESNNLNLDEVVVNGALFIVAGTETTAGFLSGLFNQLLRNKPVLARLTAEIRSTFKTDKCITFKRLVQISYLTAVIEEGLRIFPSAPIGFMRTVPEGGDTVSGHWLPGGTTVSTSMWASTHSERNFKDPYSFIPERWMDKGNTTDNLGASNPFSLGPRGCIGRNLSYMEMRLIIGKLLWHNDIEMAGPNELWNPTGDYKNMKVYSNWMKPGLLVHLTPRKD